MVRRSITLQWLMMLYSLAITLGPQDALTQPQSGWVFLFRRREALATKRYPSH